MKWQLTSLTKILKCAKDNDVVTLKAADDADSLGMVFESPSESRAQPPTRIQANLTHL
jgi:hypothetical protein